MGSTPASSCCSTSPAADRADPPVRELVTVAAAGETFDLLTSEASPPPLALTKVSLQAPTRQRP